MPLIGGELAYRFLCWLRPPAKMRHVEPDDYYDSATEKLTTHFGEPFVEQLPGKTIVDFGCGLGDIAVEMAKLGAKRVIGVEIQDEFLKAARQLAIDSGVSDSCTFVPEFVPDTSDAADFVLSLDSFEHFDDPAAILDLITPMLADDGQVLISFGWPWYHPRGGHLFACFPWAHLIITEEALVRWRSEFKDDNATKFSEVAGGLNQMYIKRLERVVSESPLEIAELSLIPIRALRWMHCKWTREFTTAIVFARLVKKDAVRRRQEPKSDVAVA